MSYDRFFINFASKERLEILTLLKNKPMNVTEIVEKLGKEQSRVSHNLKKLLTCNLVKVKQEGKKRIYSLNPDTVLPILNLAKKHVQTFCPGGCNK